MSDVITAPAIDAAALHGMMADFARFGATARGGVHRLAGSPEDGQARAHLAAWCAANGMTVRTDPIGNQFAVLDWAGPGAPMLMTGSHLDSQPMGGRFDGTYGVVAACQAVAALRRHVAATGIAPGANLCIVNWTNEEGARFQPSLIGSSVYVGRMPLEAALGCRDRDGVPLGDALASIGARGTDVAPRPPDAYIEMHVECGPELERTRRRIGLVTRWWGARKLTVVFEGKTSHTGPTPMEERRDALLAAGHLIVALRRLSGEAEGTLYTSVGRMEIEPNSPNVVPGRARLWVELRSPDREVLDAAGTKLEGLIAESAAAAGVSGAVASLEVRQPGRFDERILDLAAAAAGSFGYPTMPLDTIAAHDALPMASICPSAVIVTPSCGGLCHNEAEFTSPEDVEAGANVLLSMLWTLSRRPAGALWA